MRDDLYDDSHKRIHEKFLHLEPSKQLNIIKGLVETDGGIYRGNEISFWNTSIKLVEGLRYILLRNKVLCSGELEIKSIPTPTECYIVRIPAIKIIANTFNIKETKKSHWFEHDGFLFNRITSIKPYYYDGDVFNLSISNFPSYQISSFLCHNGGKRAGAFTIHIPVSHRDIEDFIEIQAENGDLRKKSFDIFPQIGIHDIFMKEVLKDNGGTWHTFCPHEVKESLGIELHSVFGKDFNSAYKRCVSGYKNGQLGNVGVYNAKELLKAIMKVQVEKGLPYLTFLDTLNDANPNAHDGYVKFYIGNKEQIYYNYDQIELDDCSFINALDITDSTVLKGGKSPERISLIPFNIPCLNLCTESSSNVVPDDMYHTCNLLSLVVGRIFSDEEMIQLAMLANKILDSGIDLTKNPIKETGKHNNRYRTVGIGIQGLHDYMAYNNIQWNNYKAISKVAELIEYGAVTQSIENAKKKGAFPAFKGSKWDTGEMTQRFIKHSVTDLPWSTVQDDIDKYGIRNSQNTSPAPNCQDGNNEVQIYDENKNVISVSVYDILHHQGVDTNLIESLEPAWILLESPILVPTHDGDALVERIWYNGLKPTIQIEFEDGKIYNYTENHKLLVNRNGSRIWVACGDLLEGDDIATA